MKWIFAALSVIMLPLVIVVGVVLIAASSTSGGSALTASATACVYGYPDAERIAATMERLTPDPVDEAHWARYAPDAGQSGAWAESTLDQRHVVLERAVEAILAGTPPATLTTPPLVWWNGAMPVDDLDVSWLRTPVPGWAGDLDTYLAAFTETYATDPVVLARADADVSCTSTSTDSGCPSRADTTAILATIRALESGGDYSEHRHSRSSGYTTASGNPSGAYQFLANTWNDFGGYAEAFLAPALVQDERALRDVDAILEELGDVEWIPVAWYVGMGGAEAVRSGEWSLNRVPNPAYNHVSIGEYQARWMEHYTTVALPSVDGGPPMCPTGADRVIAWAETQLGAPYAAIDPYRFGTPSWPGGTIVGSRGDLYRFAAGTVVYDCSGFVIAAWRQGGIDLAGQYGIYGSQQFDTSRLADAPRDALRPGDIAVYRPNDDGIGHVVLIHHVDDAGTVWTIEASGGAGVHIGRFSWERVKALKRL